MMRTGDGEMDTSQLESTAMDLFLPVMESATVLAAHYAKACGRTCITAQDMSYGLMYAARNVTGKHIGSLYPEIYEDEVDEMVKGLSSLMEPFIIVFLGTLIGGTVVSMYLPIFELGSVV